MLFYRVPSLDLVYSFPTKVLPAARALLRVDVTLSASCLLLVNVALSFISFLPAQQVQSKFKKAGLRVEVDRGSERLAKQIRTAEKVRTQRSFFFYKNGTWCIGIVTTVKSS